MYYCSQCGRELKEGTRFCAGCGAPVEKLQPTADEAQDTSRQVKVSPRGEEQLASKSATQAAVSARDVDHSAAASSTQPVSKTPIHRITAEVVSKTSPKEIGLGSQAARKGVGPPQRPTLRIRSSPGLKWLLPLGVMITIGLLGYMGYGLYENKQQLERVRAEKETQQQIARQEAEERRRAQEQAQTLKDQTPAALASSPEDVQPLLDRGFTPGVWEGLVNQLRIGSLPATSYPMTLEIANLTQRQGALAGTIDYPTLNCSGSLTLRDMKEGKYVLTEKINQGNQNCIDGGTIEIQNKDENAVSWEWFLPDGRRAAYTTLTKK